MPRGNSENLVGFSKNYFPIGVFFSKVDILRGSRDT